MVYICKHTILGILFTFVNHHVYYKCNSYEMELIERFKYLMKLNNLTASAFADEIGVQRSSVSHILSGRNKPSLEFIQKVLSKYPKVNADWLIAGVTKPIENSILEDTQQPNPKPRPSSIKTMSNKTIKRVLIFYNDNSFEEFTPGKE